MLVDLFVMQQAGTLHLSDEARAMLKYYHAAALVGGVYAPGNKNTYVSLRIVDVNTKNVISSTNFSVPMGPDAKKLLESRAVGSVGSRSEAGIKADEAAMKVDDPAVTGEAGKQADIVRPE